MHASPPITQYLLFSFKGKKLKESMYFFPSFVLLVTCHTWSDNITDSLTQLINPCFLQNYTCSYNTSCYDIAHANLWIVESCKAVHNYNWGECLRHNAIPLETFLYVHKIFSDIYKCTSHVTLLWITVWSRQNILHIFTSCLHVDIKLHTVWNIYPVKNEVLIACKNTSISTIFFHLTSITEDQENTNMQMKI